MPSILHYIRARSRFFNSASFVKLPPDAAHADLAMNQTLGYAHTISYFVSTRKSIGYNMIYSNSTEMEQVVYTHRRS